MRKRNYTAAISVSIGIIFILLLPILSPIYATANTDSFTDTTKINTGASANYYENNGIQANYINAGSGADGAVTVAANTYMYSTAMPAGAKGAAGARYAVSAIAANSVTLNTGTAPVGYWRMDEAANGTCTGSKDVCDTSGNGNHGTVTGTTITTGKFSNSRSLNGSTDNINAGTGGTLANLGASTMTAEAWIYPTGWGASSLGQVFAKRTAAAGWSFYLNNVNGNLQSIRFLRDTNGSTYYTWDSPASSIPLNNWTHVAVTYNGSTPSTPPTIYLNGLPVAVTQTTAGGTGYPDDTAVPMDIGIAPSGGGGFAGIIDDARVYNYVRTAAQIATDISPPPSVSLSAGDKVLLINMQGNSANHANVGTYELLTVQSATDTTVTFTTNVQNTYGVNDNSNLTGQKIMIQRVPQFTNLTVNGGVTLTSTAWNGTTGGVVAFQANGTVNVAGTISVGGLGYAGGGAGIFNGSAKPGEAPFTAAGTSGQGSPTGTGVANGYDGLFSGGGGSGTDGCIANGSGGAASSATLAGAGGGGGAEGSYACLGSGYYGYGGGGGGGSHRTSGVGGQGGNNGGTGTSSQSGAGGAASAAGSVNRGGGGGAGETYGSTDLSKMFMGSGGGGGAWGSNGGGHTNGSAGGNGGGIVYIGANYITVSGAINANGDGSVAPGANGGSGGGGAGGSIRLEGNIITLAAGITVGAGAANVAPDYSGGNGGVGRIAVYGNSISGATGNPGSTNNFSPVAGAFPSTVTIQSQNLAPNSLVDSFDTFTYNLTSLPAGTGATIQFSKDATNWFSVTNVAGATTPLSAGANSFDLTPFNWYGINPFYYKIVMDTNVGAASPILGSITLNYTSVSTSDALTDTSKINTGASSGYVLTGGTLQLPAIPTMTAYWTLDDASGATVTDSSGNGYNGTAASILATGGTVTTSGGDTIHTFAASGTLVVNKAQSAQVLVVAGGGGGGVSDSAGRNSGGGGGGGVVYNASYSLTPGSTTVTIGNGGPGNVGVGTGTDDPNQRIGQNSVFGSITANGGGGGGAGGAGAGGNGGSGGGAGRNSSTVGTGSQGSNGGPGAVGATTNIYGAGGGGGQSAVGGTGTTSVAGNGGAGYTSSISGSSVCYAGGGGGGRSAGSGGTASCGGGAGASSDAAGTLGTANTGGGGGGSGAASTTVRAGGNGGSGVVVVRYSTPALPSIISGQYGNARSFNGGGDYAGVNDTAALQLATPLTVEAWVKFTDTSPSCIVRKDTASGTRYLYSLIANIVTAGKVAAQYYNVTSNIRVESNSAVNDGNWHHIAMTISGTTVSLYVDSIFQNSGTITGTQGVPNGELDIGACPPYVGPAARGNFFNGTIDDVRIYNSALTQGQIYYDMNNRPSPRTATIVSTDLMAGLTQQPVNKFQYTLTTPAGTGATIQFSHNGTNWYAADGTLDGTTTLSAGTNTISVGAIHAYYHFYYKLVLTSTNANTPVFSNPTIFFSGSCRPPRTGNHRIIVDCTFYNLHDGVDVSSGSNNNTTLYMAQGVLTVNSNQTVVAGQVIMQGGSIAIGTSGSNKGQIIPKASVWVQDADNDGFPGSLSQSAELVSITQPVGYVRKASIPLAKASVLDCDDHFYSPVNNVCPGGDGNDGDQTIAGNLNTTVKTNARSVADGINYAVTALGTNTITTSGAAAGIAAGDEVLLINLQGSAGAVANVGNYESLQVQSVASNVITLVSNIQKTYGNSTNADLTGQKIMAQRVPNYNNLTVNPSTTLTASAWDGTKGGVLAFRANGTLTNNGTITMTALGHRGGVASTPGGDLDGWTGESLKVSLNQVTANFSGGGGGPHGHSGECDGMGGAGGGNANAGSNGIGACGGGPSSGGSSRGSSTLTQLFFGGGGGAGGGGNCGDFGSGAGGAGGGIIFLSATNFTNAGTISSDGAAGTCGCASGCTCGAPASGVGAGAGGAGGSILISSTNAVALGSNGVTTSLGAGNTCSAGKAGGNGSVGRIGVHSGTSTITGSSTPAYTTL